MHAMSLIECELVSFECLSADKALKLISLKYLIYFY